MGKISTIECCEEGLCRAVRVNITEDSETTSPRKPHLLWELKEACGLTGRGAVEGGVVRGAACDPILRGNG